MSAAFSMPAMPCCPACSHAAVASFSTCRRVLRIALFEILFDTAQDKAPVKAVINEAVELSKHYGSDSSSRFVNGVLSTVVNKP